MDKNIEKLNILVKKLLDRGERVSELEMWQKIFVNLSSKEQEELLVILEAELKQLEALDKI